jgi:lysophospholipase L1-like esterase
MLKGADSPYWERSSFATLTSNAWDIIVIMLGTNDAKDAGDGGPSNWPHDCATADGTARLDGCTFAADYASMVETVRGLNATGALPGDAAAPLVDAMAPPPV